MFAYVSNMKPSMKNSRTTILTLGVIVALLAIFLTPGFAPITDVFGSTKDLTDSKEALSKPIFEKVKSESAEAVASFLKEVRVN